MNAENETHSPADANRPIRQLVYDLEDFITRTEGLVDAASEIVARAPNGDRAGSGLIAITSQMHDMLAATREHFNKMMDAVREVSRRRDVEAESMIYDLAHMARLTQAVIDESLIAGTASDDDGFKRYVMADWERDMLLFAVGHVESMASNLKRHVCEEGPKKAA